MINWRKINNIEGKARRICFFISLRFIFRIFAFWGNQFKLKCCCFAGCVCVRVFFSLLFLWIMNDRKHLEQLVTLRSRQINNFRCFLYRIIAIENCQQYFATFWPKYGTETLFFPARTRSLSTFQQLLFCGKRIIENKKLRLVVYEARHSFCLASILLAFDVCFSEALTLSAQSRVCLLHLTSSLAPSPSLSLPCLLSPEYIHLSLFANFCQNGKRIRSNGSARTSGNQAEMQQKEERIVHRIKWQNGTAEKEKLYRWQFWKRMKCFELNGRMKMETRDLAKMSLAIRPNKTTFSLWNLKIHFGEKFQRTNQTHTHTNTHHEWDLSLFFTGFSGMDWFWLALTLIHKVEHTIHSTHTQTLKLKQMEFLWFVVSILSFAYQRKTLNALCFVLCALVCWFYCCRFNN